MGTRRYNKTIHKSRGVNTGLGVCAYFAMLFRANVKLPKSKKLTDEQIAILVEREFPDRPTAKMYRGQTKTRTINEYRYRYHTGKFTGGNIPSEYSFRYDKNGVEVDGRTGKELPNIQKHGLASQQRFWATEQEREREGVQGTQKDLGQAPIKE
jgi:hypothetical protein